MTPKQSCRESRCFLNKLSQSPILSDTFKYRNKGTGEARNVIRALQSEGPVENDLGLQTVGLSQSIRPCSSHASLTTDESLLVNKEAAVLQGAVL